MNTTDYKNSPKIVYIRNNKNFPVGCIAYSFDKHNWRLTFGYSIYNPKDKFNRQLARHVATQRFLKKARYITCKKDSHVNLALADMCQFLLSCDTLPLSFQGALSVMIERFRFNSSSV